MTITRRSLLQTAAAGAAVSAFGLPAVAQAIDELVIAYNVTLPSWDPTTGPSAVNPTIQGLYQSVFDQFILQQPDLKPAPGLLTDWGWNDDKTKIHMTVREGVTWHDGSPVTAEDVFAYTYAMLAQPAFTSRFATELQSRELRLHIHRIPAIGAIGGDGRDGRLEVAQPGFAEVEVSEHSCLAPYGFRLRVAGVK